MGKDRIVLTDSEQKALLRVVIEEYIEEDKVSFQVNPRIVAWLLEHIQQLKGEIEDSFGDRPVMSVEEFQRLGYLQELNRVFLHRLGLALSVRVDRNNRAYLFGPVYDNRDNSEGFIFESFTEGEILRGRRIEHELMERGQARIDGLGFVIQPLEKKE